MTYGFYVDWNDDGLWTGTGEDVTARVLARDDVIISYGRDQDRALSPVAPGRAGFLLNNISKDYSPENAASPLTGNVKAYRPVKLEKTHLAVTYGLYRGFIDEFEVLPDLMDRSARVGCLDALASLRDIPISTQIRESTQTGAAIGYILDEIGWPSADRDLDTGATTIRYWWEEGTDAMSALERVVASEGPPALVYINPADGKFVFRDRHHRLTRTASTTSQATFRDTGTEPVYATQMPYDTGLRDIVNSAAITVDERDPDGSSSVVWESERTYSLAAAAAETIEVEASDPFQDAITPVVSTDYQLRSGSVTVSLSRTSGQSITITLTAGASGCRITDLRLRAYYIPVKRTVKVSKTDSASISTYREKGPPQRAMSIARLRARSANSTQMEAPWANQNDAAAIAQLIVNHRGSRLPIIKLRVIGVNDTRMTQILTRKLSDRITVINAELGMTAGTDFYIESITHKISEAGLYHEAVFGLEKVPSNLQVPSELFRFDTAGQGFDQGRFAY